MKSTAWLLSLSLGAVAAAVPLSACSSNQNHEERESSPEAKAVAAERMNAAMNPKDAPIGAGLPDPGSRPVNCEKLKDAANYEYAWAWDYADYLGKARGTYSYDDNTPTLVVPPHNGWEPAADAYPACDANLAVRFKGGPFTEYGGGFGRSFCSSATNECKDMKTEGGEPLPISAEFPEHPDPATYQGALDLGGWDGVAIWIRRGPNGQPGLRVGITEQNSAEDLNTGTPARPELEGRNCQRFRSCGCAPGIPCTDGYCKFPGEPPPSTTTDANGAVVDQNLCGTPKCNANNTSFTALDPLFGGRSCEQAQTSDGRTDYYCYDPGKDPNPPAKRERCGSPFSKPIIATLDWQLVRVPFTELRQNDDMDVADAIDLHSVKQLVFTHTTGLIDFYVGNIGFYRKR